MSARTLFHLPWELLEIVLNDLDGKSLARLELCLDIACFPMGTFGRCVLDYIKKQDLSLYTTKEKRYTRFYIARELDEFRENAVRVRNCALRREHYLSLWPQPRSNFFQRPLTMQQRVQEWDYVDWVEHLDYKLEDRESQRQVSSILRIPTAFPNLKSLAWSNSSPPPRRLLRMVENRLINLHSTLDIGNVLPLQNRSYCR